MKQFAGDSIPELGEMIVVFVEIPMELHLMEHSLSMAR
jgi:hypothetical protein